jgi:hypothetical protein
LLKKQQQKKEQKESEALQYSFRPQTNNVETKTQLSHLACAEIQERRDCWEKTKEERMKELSQK